MFLKIEMISFFMCEKKRNLNKMLKWFNFLQIFLTKLCKSNHQLFIEFDFLQSFATSFQKKSLPLQP